MLLRVERQRTRANFRRRRCWWDGALLFPSIFPISISIEVGAHLLVLVRREHAPLILGQALAEEVEEQDIVELEAFGLVYR